MTAEEMELLKGCEGRIVALEMAGGEQFFAEIQIVVDEPPTPDVFVLRVQREADGAFVAAEGDAGESILLGEIARVALIPGVEY